MSELNNKVELFPCYSFKLKDFLFSKEIKYKLVGLHPHSRKQFFVFVEDEKFKSAIKEWERNKPSEIN